MEVVYGMSDDFATQSNVNLINSDIDAYIPTVRTSSTLENTSVRIVYDRILTTEESSTIYGYFVSRDNAVQLGHNQLSYTISSSENVSASYAMIISFIFEPAITQGITHMKFNGYVTGPSYDVRLYDILNDTVIASGNFTNAIPAINTLTIQSIPTSNTILELQCKVNNSTAIISSFTIYYN